MVYVIRHEMYIRKDHDTFNIRLLSIFFGNITQALHDSSHIWFHLRHVIIINGWLVILKSSLFVMLLTDTARFGPFNLNKDNNLS